jgi:PH and SEC7 domain-containing protein
MDAFIPPSPLYPLPLPPLPVSDERPAADVFSSSTIPTTSSTTTTRPGTGTRKPLPPVLQHAEEIENRPVMVKKPRALPKIPISPNAKRRSLSVHDADDKSPTPPADTVVGDHNPKEIAVRLEDNLLHGLLDVFKGELSTLDPVSPTSLDLRDPSTPVRKRPQANDPDAGGGGERDEEVKSPPISAPATVSRRVEQEDKSAPVAIIPPRSSSLQSPVYSIGSSFHATSLRQASYPLTPLRLRTGPAAATPSKHLRAVHRATASSSEPSLIPASDERGCE